MATYYLTLSGTNANYFGSGVTNYTLYNTIIGNENADTIYDYYNGSSTIVGGLGGSYIYTPGQGTTSGFDTINANNTSGTTTVYTHNSSGGDKVYGATGGLLVHGEAGTAAQTIDTGSGTATVYGGTGNDIISNGGGGNLTAYIDSGSKTVYLNGGADHIYSGQTTATNSYINSFAKAGSVYDLYAGSDTVLLQTAGQTVNLHSGNHTIGLNSSGNEYINGSASTGNASVYVNSGSGNYVQGGNGTATPNVIAVKDQGNDTLVGGSGATPAAPVTNVFYDYASSNDQFYGGTNANNYFEFLSPRPAESETIANWTNTAATHDYLFFPASQSGTVGFYQNGADTLAYEQFGSSYFTVNVKNATVADVQSHTIFA